MAKSCQRSQQLIKLAAHTFFRLICAFNFRLTVRADMGSVWTPGRHLSKNSVSYWRSKITTKIVIVLKHVFCQSVQSVKC